MLNKSSNELGKQYAPTKLQPFITDIADTLQQFINEHAVNFQTEVSIPAQMEIHIMQLSREITSAISAKGYNGSERTVRNYIRTHYIT